MNSSSSLDLPPTLVDSVREQRAVLFLGAGASRGALHEDPVDIPQGNNLRDKLSEQFLGGELKNRSLSQVAELCINESDLTTVQTFIRKLFIGFKPAPFHSLIPTFRWHAIATTNYDLVVERAYEGVDDRLQELVPFVKNGEQVDARLKEAVHGVQYLKLHGCINHFGDGEVPLILATEQYVKYIKNRTRLFGRLQDWGHEHPIIFCGYAIGDPHVQTILFDLFDLDISRPPYYVVLPQLTKYEERYWTKHRIFPIKASLEDFLLALDVAIPQNLRVVPVSVGGGTATIRTHYRTAQAAESSTLLEFIANDVDHVRKGMPVAPQDARAFYHGYDSGWGAIEVGLDVHRRIVDTLLVDAVLAEEEERAEPVDFFVVKGPAGNGKTIVLKRTAWEAAHEFGKLVLFLRTGGAIRHEAIQEISNLIGQRFFLFVDRAAIRHQEIRKLIEFCQKFKLRVTIISAERDNEWNVRCEDLDEFVAKDYPVRYLSEKEIHDLLKKLDQHKSLNFLERLSYDARVDFFLNHAQRQILVALHEATLGDPFVDIVTDEYKRIVPPEAQNLYLDVCTLSRLGVGVRAGLVSRISGIRFDDFEKRFFKPLQHVVKTYRDQYLADYVYTARHQHVAELVFDSVLTDPELKYDQIVRLIGGMNLDYSTDLEAFRQLIRGRVVAETFRSQELGRRFYSVLQSLVGEDPYLLQQLGLFEMRHPGGDLKRAEAVLQKAVALAPHDRSIKHSFANLARLQAQETDNPVLRQTYRRRAMERLEGLVGRVANQPHGFYTAAQVALDELRDLLVSTENSENDTAVERQIVALARRVENHLSEGLQRFPDNPQLLSVEADYRDSLDQHELAEEALQHAFSANPRQDWIATRLSRRLADAGRIDDAKAILKKCVQENPGSKRVHLSLAKLYLHEGTSAEQLLVLDHLGRSFSHGDANYDAQFWYARELFLRQKHDEADALFAELRHASVPPEVRGKIRGIVRNSEGDILKVRATVVTKEETYMFVQGDEYGRNIFAHMSSVPEREWDTIKRGSVVIVEVGFTMRGPIAATVSLES